MFKEQDGDSVEVPHSANGKYLEHKSRETVGEVYQTIHTSSLDQFTFSLIDSLWNGLNAVLRELDGLPEAAFKELMEVIEVLNEARDELRLARFLFDVEEINPIHRLIMRNRAVLRSRDILCRALQVWPLHVAL